MTSVSEGAVPTLTNQTLFPFSCNLALPLASTGNLKKFNFLVEQDIPIVTRNFCGGGVPDGIVDINNLINNLQSLQSLKRFLFL